MPGTWALSYQGLSFYYLSETRPVLAETDFPPVSYMQLFLSWTINNIVLVFTPVVIVSIVIVSERLLYLAVHRTFSQYVVETFEIG